MVRGRIAGEALQRRPSTVHRAGAMFHCRSHGQAARHRPGMCREVDRAGAPVGFHAVGQDVSVHAALSRSVSLRDCQTEGRPLLLFPTDLASFFELVRQHGDAAYSFIFAYAASHSLLLALFAGYAAHSGALNFGTLILVCWLGSFFGDVIRFWIGRRFGTRWLSPFPRLERAVRSASRLVDRYYVWMILFHRYPHGIRGVAGIAYGMSQLPWTTFLPLNLLAAGLWSCGVVSAGFAFGQVSEKLMSDASSGLGFVMLAAFLVLSWILSKKLDRIVERS